MSRQLARCAGVAFSKRGNQMSGVEIRRPSAKMTVRSSSVQCTSTASVEATGLLAKMLIPCKAKLRASLCNQGLQLAQFRTTKPARLRKPDRFQPKLGVTFSLLNMYMPRFHAFPAKKEEPEVADTKDGWQITTLEICRSTVNQGG